MPPLHNGNENFKVMLLCLSAVYAKYANMLNLVGSLLLWSNLYNGTYNIIIIITKDIYIYWTFATPQMHTSGAKRWTFHIPPNKPQKSCMDEKPEIIQQKHHR